MADTMSKAKIIDGSVVARRIKEETAREVSALARDGVQVSLHAVMVG